MSKSAKLISTIACMLVLVSPAFGQDEYSTCTEDGWLEKSDADFAIDCVDMAFESTLDNRQLLAWMFFARVNQLITDPEKIGMSKAGMPGTGKVPIWMAWPTDTDTFQTTEPFDFQNAPPRSSMEPSAEKKDLKAGRISTADPDGANEEVTRNQISYDYLIENRLTTKADVHAFLSDNNYVNMPVGSVEMKASWLQVTEGSPAPAGSLMFKFNEGEYWWRGLHIMVKMRSLQDPKDAFYTEKPSWFWTTFEFNENPGVTHVRDALNTQHSPLPKERIIATLEAGGLANFGFDAYSPNGTQIRFTRDGDGHSPVILGHTDMEDFAGSPNKAQARYWTRFEASCHSCHATASYNPTTKAFFPFSVPTGALDPSYNMSDAKGIVRYLGQGYKSLDFMWPIAFQTR